MNWFIITGDSDKRKIRRWYIRYILLKKTLGAHWEGFKEFIRGFNNDKKEE